ncbi:MAG: thioesterase family protein [Pseudomonadota bacterium]
MQSPQNLPLLHESTVLPEEIDSLGHMNVRHYMARMQRANRTLIDGLGMAEATFEHSMLRSIDTYTRFRREQFEGAPLHTVGGILSLDEGGMQSYIEIRNAESQATAATFIVTTALIDRHTRQAQPFPIAIRDIQAANTITTPDYATPRSLTLDRVNTSVTLEQLAASIPDVAGGGMMSGRRDAILEADDVDADGWLREDIELMFLPFAKMAAEEGVQQGPPVFETADGRKVGWAVMETRTMLFAQPRLHDELAYFSADLHLEAKSRLSRRWALNRDTGQLLGMSDTVGVCIDLQARRAIEWPAELRAQIEQYLRPQLA